MVEIFKALAEESRLRILALLTQGEMCVCEIEECLNMTQSNASRHLAALKQCGILDSSKQAQWSYYKISEKFKEENKKLWLYLEEKLKESPDYKKDAEEYLICRNKNLCGSRTSDIKN
ncbi:MAG: winged helix-turn-helix transcriptional regulator [Clostridiales bacterium]|nr:winged helix-turn-helix transcriptional regulator [Clostridiales bacterium]